MIAASMRQQKRPGQKGGRLADGASQGWQ